MRAVEISTGEILSENLVRTVFAIFDKNGDQMVSTSIRNTLGKEYTINQHKPWWKKNRIHVKYLGKKFLYSKYGSIKNYN